MFSLRILDSKVLRIAVYVYFLKKKKNEKKNEKCNVRNFRRFLFCMSPDIPAFRVLVFTSDFEFWIGINECFAHSLTFIALSILREISIRCRWLVFGVNYCVNF